MKEKLSLIIPCYNEQGEPKIRSLFARMFYKIINRISDADIVDGARDFRLMKRAMVDSIVRMCEYNRFSKGIMGQYLAKTYMEVKGRPIYIIRETNKKRERKNETNE